MIHHTVISNDLELSLEVVSATVNISLAAVLDNTSYIIYGTNYIDQMSFKCYYFVQRDGSHRRLIRKQISQKQYKIQRPVVHWKMTRKLYIHIQSTCSLSWVPSAFCNDLEYLWRL